MSLFHQPANSIGNYSYNIIIYDDVDYGLHFHRNYEIIYVIKGEADCSVNGKSKILKEGEFAFCLSNEIHSIKSRGSSKIWIGVFSQDFIQEFKKYHDKKSGADFSFRCSGSINDYLLQNLIKKDVGDTLVIKSCLYAFCSEYLRQIPLIQNDTKQLTLTEDILKYVESNYKKTISLSSAASELGYEYCYFSKIFTRLFSMGFNDYVNTFRFNEACALLIKTDMSITDICYESGFQSVRSFNHIFKKLSGFSPSDYRKSLEQRHS